MSKSINPKYYIENAPDGIFGDHEALPKNLSLADGFVGREDYLDELRKAYQAGTRKFVLHGLGGVGKTALALKFANEIAKEYLALIQVEMLGMSEQPFDCRRAMFEIIRQFGQEIPSDTNETTLRSIYASRAQNQPTLIVLDNAKDLRAVKDLAPYNICLIVTSREEFILAGGNTEKIWQMSPEDARKLLYSIADESLYAERGDKLAELAGYLPMALKPLAALVRDEDETISELITRYERQIECFLHLQDVDHDDLTIFASFELSYQKLSPDFQERWRHLTIFPADFDRDGAAAIWQIEDEQAAEPLKHLRKSNLLDRDEQTKRYSLHDTARKYGLVKLTEMEKFNVGRLHARYYVSVLWQAKEIRDIFKESALVDALALIDREWSNITTGQQFAAEFMEGDNDIAEICSGYGGALYEVILRLRPREYVKWLLSSLAATQKLGNKKWEGIHLSNLGIAYGELSEYQKAIEFFEQSLQISREFGDRQGEGSRLTNLGNAYRNLGEYHKAIEHFEQALGINREFGDQYGESRTLGGLGIAYFELGEYQKAIEYFEQALGISREIGDQYGESIHLSNLGNAYRNLGEYQKAIEYFEQALRFYREIRDQENIGGLLRNQGIAYRNLGEHQKACELWREALAIFEGIESPSADSVQRLLAEYCQGNIT